MSRRLKAALLLAVGLVSSLSATPALAEPSGSPSLLSPAALRLHLPAQLGLPTLGQRTWGTPGEQDETDARQLAAQGRCDAALAAFDRAIAVRQRSGALRRDRARCHDKLGNHDPAIEDYRAYLAMTPGAPDAQEIQQRMEQLQALQTDEGKLAPGVTGGTDPADVEAPAPAHGRSDTGMLFGLHAGYSLWSDGGLPENTSAIGLRFGWRYAKLSELELRGRLLQSGTSGVSASTGWSLSAGQIWFIELNPEWELGFGVGAGFERHTTKLRTARTYIHGRAGPSARWNFSRDLALDVGVEAGAGLMTSESTAGGEQQNDFVVRYGGLLGLSWRWGHTSADADGSSGNTDPSDSKTPDDEPW